jgi:cytochrome bd-type quinol oxidase subunit 2
VVTRPAARVALAALLGGAWLVFSGVRRARERRAMAGSCAVVASLVATAAAALFPVVLPSTLGTEHSLTAHHGATAPHGLAIAIVWWPLAAALAITYLVVIARAYRGKVRPAADTQG